MIGKIIDTGSSSAEDNMAIDAALLRDLRSSQQPVLHFYEWEGDCATYGHFLNPYTYLDRSAVERYGLHLARRPTGGGIVFHLNDFAYSMLIPASHPQYSVNTLDNYAFINNLVARAVQQFMGLETTPSLLEKEPQASHFHADSFCMAKPTLNDVMWQGKKVGGGAQRRTRHGFLHQGTISLGKPEGAVIRKVLKEENLFESMLQNGFYFEERRIDPEAIKDALKRVFNEAFS